MQLVIVESPSKAKTINKYLGPDYVVTSSVCHIRDLPKSNKNAIDIEGGFIPFYEISSGKVKVVSDLIKQAKKADTIILATDQDREGEAIAWHLGEILKEELGKNIEKKFQRVTFNSITKETILEAIEHPRTIDQNLRKAQEARRVLDRLVGYDLSGLIWKKLRYGLSAGRVQSPALRILMEREREIRAFIPEDYYVLAGEFNTSTKKSIFQLVCDKELPTAGEAQKVIDAARSGTWKIIALKESEQQRKPRAPFTTSTLQQVASTRLGMSPSRTMRAAQKLYEAGHITYMRTDSTSISKQALAMTAKQIEKQFGKKYVEVKNFATKSKNAQEAHEAVRPTKIDSTVSRGNTEDQKRLYELIWRRTVASQMIPAKIMKTKLSANIANPPLAGGGAEQSEAEGVIPNFSTNGSRVIFDGWLAADPTSRGEDVEVPKLAEGDKLNLVDIQSEQKWTQPPNRYSEAGLIKELEKRGIGRPSTYASIIQTIQNRGYVEKEGRTLIPTDTGDVVSSFLEEHFMKYVGDDFTAEMENHLDEIAAGDAEYVKILTDFYTPFHKDVTAKEDIPKITNLGEADKKFKCPTCKKSMVIKLGRGGKFLSCSTYPDCEGALTLEGKELGGDGEALGQHPESGENIYLREGRFGPYVQLGESPEKPGKDASKAEKAAFKELPKPKRASLPKDKSPSELTLEEAVHLLILPRTLGNHPDDGEPVIANVGRFGPYVGHGKNFRSLKPKKGEDPYKITLKEALEILAKPKALPRGTTLVRVIGKHPKTGKELRVLESKSGKFLQKGMKRLYLPDNAKVEEMTVEEAVAFIAAS